MTCQTSFKYKIDHACPPFRFMKTMGSTGTDLSLHGGTVSVPEVQLARELSVEEVAIMPAPGVTVTDALRSYVETVQVLSRIIAD